LNGEPAAAHIGAHDTRRGAAGQFGLGGGRELRAGPGPLHRAGEWTAVGCFICRLADGAEVTTVEHAGGEGLDAVQEAFIEAGAFQRVLHAGFVS
jgi:hypothetical protein